MEEFQKFLEFSKNDSPCSNSKSGYCSYCFSVWCNLRPELPPSVKKDIEEMARFHEKIEAWR